MVGGAGIGGVESGVSVPGGDVTDDDDRMLERWVCAGAAVFPTLFLDPHHDRACFKLSGALLLWSCKGITQQVVIGRAR